VNVDHAGSERAADCINLGFDPDGIDNDAAIICQGLDYFAKCVRNPMTACFPVQGFSGAL
jgi:hypothetical protein